jgi:hypothetical protein
MACRKSERRPSIPYAIDKRRMPVIGRADMSQIRGACAFLSQFRIDRRINTHGITIAAIDPSASQLMVLPRFPKGENDAISVPNIVGLAGLSVGPVVARCRDRPTTVPETRAEAGRIESR